MARMLETLEVVLAALPRPAVLIGGVAVACRLGRVERTTADIDAVVDAPEDPSSVRLLVDAGIAEGDADRVGVTVKGVKVDLIDTFAVPDEAFAGAVSANEHFASAHRYGYETGSPMRLAVQGRPAITVSVAEPQGLVAMKLHAARYRRNPAKRPGDIFDVYRLLDVFDRQGAMAAAIAERRGLAELCLGPAETLFGADGLTRTAGVLSQSGDAVISAVSRAELDNVCGEFTSRLRRQLFGDR